MVELSDAFGGFIGGFVLADLLTIPYSASALYLSIRGKYYWKIPYAVPIRHLTKERIVNIGQFSIPVPRLHTNPLKLSVRYWTIPGRVIKLDPSSNPIKFAILTPLLVPWLNRSLTFPLQCIIAFAFMIIFCWYQSKGRDDDDKKRVCTSH